MKRYGSRRERLPRRNQEVREYSPAALLDPARLFCCAGSRRSTRPVSPLRIGSWAGRRTGNLEVRIADRADDSRSTSQGDR